MTPSFTAVLLAAGRSIRMGRDKALLEVAGAPLWRRQRDVLREAGAAEIFLSARPDQTWAARADGFAAVLHDALPDCGPLIGLTAALERTARGHVAVLAIDLPQMSATWFQSLLAGCGPGVGAVGERSGFFEPLAAVYPVELKWNAWEAIAAGRYALQPLVAGAVAAGLVQAREITAADAPLFANWNEGARPTGGVGDSALPRA